MDSHIPDRIWQNLWRHQGWMKIKLFMWLVHHKKILTWDNIRKRGVLWPSRCQLCEAQEETMEHLLNSCIFTSRLWDTFATIFQQTDRDKGSIITTLNNWRRNFFYYEFLGSTWDLTPRFIIWNVWKERNKRIFKNEKSPSHRLLEQILKQLRETVGTTVRNPPKNPPLEAEMRILSLLGMQGLIPQGLDRKLMKMDTEKDFWHPPPQGFLQYNIDEASKGNLGTVGLGGALRDEEGSIIFIFHCHLRRATNNMAELMAMEQCLDFLKQDNCLNVIIEADFELIINSIKRISCGMVLKKVSKHSRLI